MTLPAYAGKEAIDGDSRVLGFGLEQVTLLVHTSTDQSRDLELSL